jgi:two-component system, cell cycle response regulator
MAILTTTRARMIHLKACLLLLLLCTTARAASTDELLNQLEATEDNKAALTLVRQLEPSVSKLSALDQGRYYVRLGLIQEDELLDIDSADRSFNRAVELLEPLPEPSQALADAYYERAYIKYIKTHDTAVYCPDRQKAVALTRQLNNTERLAKYLTALAFCYTDAPERFQQGLAILDEAMTLAESSNVTPDQRGLIYNATALLYQKNLFFDKAYEYSQLAYDQWVSVKNIQGMDNQQHTLLINAINMSNLDKAEEHGKQLFALANAYPEFKDFKFFAYYDNGTIALVKKDLVRAIGLFKQAKAEEKNTEETIFIAQNRMRLAIALFLNGNTEAALDEAVSAAKLPGYASLDPGNQQAIQAILQFKKLDAPQAMRTLFNLVSFEQEQHRQILKGVNRNYANQHEDRVRQFEKQLLENQLQIQKLQLAAQQRQQKTSRWLLLLTSVAALSLAMWAYTLLRSRRRFRKQAQTDALTGIANRRHFFEIAQQLAKRAQPQQLVSLLVFDIDHFKRINDTYGHQVGDAVIKHVAVNTQTCLRTQDLLGRTGGEEFAAVLPHTDVDQAWEIAERIRERIERTPIQHNGHNIHITISIGLTSGDLSSNDAENLLQMADHAMYRAKGAGRNRSHLAANITNRASPNETPIPSEA